MTHVHEVQEFLGDPANQALPVVDKLVEGSGVDVESQVQEFGKLLHQLAVQGLVRRTANLNVILQLLGNKTTQKLIQSKLRIREKLVAPFFSLIGSFLLYGVFCKV